MRISDCEFELSGLVRVQSRWMFQQFEIRSSNFMSQPEISHRCASCGASVREPAMFCPDCGKPLSSVSEDSAQSASSEALNSPTTTAGAPDPPAQASEGQPATPSLDTKETVPGTKRSPESADALISPGSGHGARERTREALQRASSVARGALEDNVKRVEKIHHVSTAMIEEASYDPSLRFVLVALGLFVIFVILLVLSKVMG